MSVDSVFSFVNELYQYARPMFAPFFSAMFGAMFAALIASRKEKNKIKEDRIASVNVAISCISLYLDKIIAIQRQILDEFEDNKYRHVLIKSVLAIESPRVSIDYRSISFLLGHDCRVIVGEIVAAEERLMVLIALINKRSELHYDEVQKKLEKAGLTESQTMVVTQVIEMIGSRVDFTLRLMTDDVYELCDELIESFYVLAARLSEDAVRILGRGKIIKIIRPQTSEKVS